MKKKTPEALGQLIQDEMRAERTAEKRSKNFAKARVVMNANRWARKKAKAEEHRLWKKLNHPRWKSGTNAQRQIGAEPGWMLLWRRMAPGAWYADEDLVALMPEYAYGSPRAWLHQKLKAKGMVERAAKPREDNYLGHRPEFLYRRVEGFG